MKYHVTYYEEYSIYEPAEGGYYYPGVSMVESESYNTLKEARAALKRLGEEYGMKRVSINRYAERSRYIGGEKFITIETTKGSEESGKQIYC